MDRRNGMYRILWCIIIGFVVHACPLIAQSGKISGKIVDGQTRQGLPGVNVLVEGSTLGAATDSDGDYFIINVPPGSYTLQASMIGYATISKTGVLVQMDRTVVIDFVLGAQAIQGEEVTISAEREIIHMDISGSTTHYQAEEFSTAPVTQVADYLQIQEGVDFASSSQGKWLSIRGGSRDETDFMIDGMSMMNTNTNVAYMSVSKTAIKEVSIQTGGFNAEYGRVRSGLVNVVTRDGSRQEYSMAWEGQYSAPALKHFGRNLFDKNSAVYLTREGTGNFIPGEFQGASFLPDGDSQSWGIDQGEVVINQNSPEYRGWFYNKETDTYTDSDGIPYSTAERDQYQMNPISTYPGEFQWSGWKDISEQYAGGTVTDDVYPADLMAEWMWQHQGLEYGQDPDYNMDMTITGPLPGERMHNKIGDLLAKSTFMLSYRTQTSRLVYPDARRAYRDNNLQAKITTTISPQTKLRITGVYSEQISVSNYSAAFPIDAKGTGNDFYQDDFLSAGQETISGVRGGGRVGGSLGRRLDQLFSECINIRTYGYAFQTGAKLTHTPNPKTYFELEYQYQQLTDNGQPNWNRDYYTNQFWIFNLDGQFNERGEPRTFVTTDPDDIFVGGSAQYFDPVIRDLWIQSASNLSAVPAANVNDRNRVFSTGGTNTWMYSPELRDSWFDQQYDGIGALKGNNRLYMARGYDNAGVPVSFDDPSLLPGTWDWQHPLNAHRMPDLTDPRNGGLIDGQTLPGITLVEGDYSRLGFYQGDTFDRLNQFYFGRGAQPVSRKMSRINMGRMTMVSQMNKYNQMKLGWEMRFYQIDNMEGNFTGNQPIGQNASSNTAVPGQGLWDIRGNWNAIDWRQYYENPVDMAAYLQDKIEVQGLIANIGVRMDMFDPTTQTIDFSDPYRAEFASRVMSNPENGPSHWHETTDKVKAQVRFKWSPRLGLSFPVTETSKVYFNYGWFYQRPSMAQYYQYEHFSRTYAIIPTRIPNANLEWPRTIQMEMGYEQNIKGWVLFHAAGYYKDSDNLIDTYNWENYDGSALLVSHVNNNYTDVRGIEFRVDKNYGLFRSRLNYNYMLRNRGQSGASKSYENFLLDIAERESTLRSIRDNRVIPQPTLRGTLGFFTPRQWGPRIGGATHPLDNVLINMIFQWTDGGERIHRENSVRPDLNIWVDNVDRTNTDLRAEKRIGIGRRVNLGLFVQVYNLWNQKYLVGPNGNQAISEVYQSAYDNAFRYDTQQGASVPAGNDKWGEYKPEHLRDTLPWFIDAIMFGDKRDVIYGLTFTFN